MINKELEINGIKPGKINFFIDSNGIDKTWLFYGMAFFNSKKPFNNIKKEEYVNKRSIVDIYLNNEKIDKINIKSIKKQKFNNFTNVKIKK